MKRLNSTSKIILLIAILFLNVAVFFSACGEKNEFKNSYRDNIIGQWKLLEVSVSVNYLQFDTTNYSNENIIFDFQGKNKLIIMGNIIDSLSLFNDFQEGVYFYEYFTFDCHSDPGLDLLIDRPEHGSENGNYYYCNRLSEQTMGIGNDGWIIRGSDYYRWYIKFIKLNK